jgi:hypothetical protein
MNGRNLEKSGLGGAEEMSRCNEISPRCGTGNDAYLFS